MMLIKERPELIRPRLDQQSWIVTGPERATQADNDPSLPALMLSLSLSLRDLETNPEPSDVAWKRHTHVALERCGVWHGKGVAGPSGTPQLDQLESILNGSEQFLLLPRKVPNPFFIVGV